MNNKPNATLINWAFWGQKSKLQITHIIATKVTKQIKSFRLNLIFLFSQQLDKFQLSINQTCCHCWRFTGDVYFLEIQISQLIGIVFWIALVIVGFRYSDQAKPKEADEQEERLWETHSLDHRHKEVLFKANRWISQSSEWCSLCFWSGYSWSRLECQNFIQTP